MWQVSGAHGAIDPARAVDEMFAYHEAGFTTWDLADHYGPAEDFIDNYRRLFAARHGTQRLPEIQAKQGTESVGVQRLYLSALGH